MEGGGKREVSNGAFISGNQFQTDWGREREGGSEERKWTLPPKALDTTVVCGGLSVASRVGLKFTSGGLSPLSL